MKLKTTKKYKLEIIALSVVLCFVMAQSVMSTITQTDKLTTTDDSGLVINYEEGWINVWNATIDNESVTTTEITNWNTGYGWGDHSLLGYLTSNGDPFFNASDAEGFTWEMADSWNSTSGVSAPSLGLIRNSNNNSYPVDGTDDDIQIQEAIDDVGTYGSVWVGCDTTISSPISMDGRDGIKLDFENNAVTLVGDIEFINITDCLSAIVKNVIININNGVDQVGNIISLYSDSWANRVDFCVLENIYINNAGGRDTNWFGTLDIYNKHNYTGLSLVADGALADRIDTCVFRDITMEGAGTGIYIYNSGTSYVNGNLFENIYLDEFETGINLVTDGINHNVFNHIKTQANPITLYGVIVNGEFNHFNDILIWDWNTVSVCPSAIYDYWIQSDALLTRIITHNVAQTNTVPDNMLDQGQLTYFYSDNVGTINYDSDYDYKISFDGTYYHARFGEYGGYATGGSFDRTTDFQALMFNILANDNIIVRFESGTYVPDAIINVNGYNITLIGEKDHSSIIKCSANVFGSGIFSMIGTTEHNMTFKYLTLDGTDAVTSAVGIRWGGNSPLNGLTVENCKIMNFNVGSGVSTASGILVQSLSDDIQTNINIKNNIISNCDFAIALDGDGDPSIIEYADISHNYLTENINGIECDYLRNSTISNNRVRSSVASSDGIILDDCIDVVVTSNIVTVVDDGLVEEGSPDYNILSLNNLRSCGDPITVVGGNTINDNNLT